MSTDIFSRLQASLGDRYRLDRVLGRGGMATVYLAHDLRHDRTVALKVFHPELGAALGERFILEIRVAARLGHPHILTVHDSGDADGLLWYTMPVVDGESLRQRIKREGPLPQEEAVRIGRSVAEARCVEGLTGGGVGSTVEAAVVTTSFAGKPRLWPTALSLAEGMAPVPGSRGVVVDDGASPGASQGKCFGSKGRSVFQTAKTRWRSLRMQWPMATSPRVPLDLRR